MSIGNRHARRIMRKRRRVRSIGRTISPARFPSDSQQHWGVIWPEIQLCFSGIKHSFATMCKTDVSEWHSHLSAMVAIRAATRDTRNNDDLINSATKAALGFDCGTVVLNDRIVSCRLTRLVRPISAFAFKRRVASAITGWVRSVFLSFSHQTQSFESHPLSILTAEKSVPSLEKMTTVKRLRSVNFTAPCDKCTAETRILPSPISAVNGGGKIYSILE